MCVPAAVLTACTRCITCLPAAARAAALSPGSTGWLSALCSHTAGGPAPHAAETASLTDDSTEREGCIAEDSPPPPHLAGEQRTSNSNRKDEVVGPCLKREQEKVIAREEIGIRAG